jgi:adenylate kinase
MSKQQPQVIILFGRSGCGKGTQAKLLIKEFGFNYLGSGSLLRERAKKDDFSGKKLKEIMEEGGLVPTPVMFKTWAEEIEKMRKKINKKGIIIDGSPRSLLEAKLMDSVFEWYDWKNVKVILLDISEQEAFDRLTKRRTCKECGRLIPWIGDFRRMKVCDKCGGELVARVDDKPEAIKARLEYYKRDVQPAVDYYQEQGRLIKVDGEKSIEDVYQDVKKAIED